MTAGPRVSVVLTCYNQARYLSQALESIGQQTFRDFEVVVVDDGSSDGSLELLREFGRQSNVPVRVCTHTGHRNRGIEETYLLGLSETRASLVAFLEADDSWSNNFLEEKVAVFDQHPGVGVVFSALNMVTEEGYGKDMIFRQVVLTRLFPRGRPFGNFGNLLRHNNVATFSAFMARAPLLKALARSRDGRMPYLDWWMLTLLSMNTKFYFETASRTNWRLSRSSFMGGLSFTDHKAGLAVFFEQLYSAVEDSSGKLGRSDLKCFHTMKKAMPCFVEFYSKPGPRAFFRLFARNPRWALEAVVSYIINARKYP